MNSDTTDRSTLGSDRPPSASLTNRPLGRSHFGGKIVAPVALLAALLIVPPAAGAEDQAIDFSRDVRPILNKYCTSCHGGVKQAGDVSFVHANQVLPPEGWVVEPGDAEASLLIERIKTEDPDERMPPPDEHPDPLSAEEIAVLERWINQGAAWSNSWALEPLRKADAEGTSAGTESPSIDRYVREKWSGHELQGSPAAPPQQWLRRASLDLIGLPPTLEQTRAFVDSVAQASSEQQRDAIYATKVDELLASNHFGERWASVWMDLARYADSKGFEKDPHRDMWPYRDWLIRAFNADMPYDEFTVKQLAGDLLPDATAADIIATAFHRNTQTNTEGGTDDEEFRVAAIVDRVNTTWTVWQATTMGCVQCHSHPYDAIKNEEFYVSMALFDNSLDADLPDDYPFIKVPSSEADLEQAVAAQRTLDELRLQRNQIGYQQANAVTWTPIQADSAASSSGRLKVVEDTVRVAGGTYPIGVQYTVEASAQTMTGLRIEIFPEFDDPLKLPAHGAVLSHLQVHLVDKDGQATAVELADVFADSISGASQPRDALNDSSGGVGEYPKLNAVRTACFVLKTAVEPKPGDRLRLTMAQKESTAGSLATPIRKFRWSVSDDAALIELENNSELETIDARLKNVQDEVAKIQGAALPVIQSRPDDAKRLTRRFVRGNWMERGELVQPDVPQMFRSSESGDRIQDRLQFASWLVSKENPLTARVWANRIWSQLFGSGLVVTLEDFGSSGQQPTHRELLDFLAYRLREDHRWHLKPFLKEVVLSATYRQTNHASPQHQANDPANRWLARGPRTRLTAEMVRDQALTASGLLSPAIGGPSVMPPQPDGIWQTVYSGSTWETATDDKRYRRALYTYWRRTSPYPSFLTFDSPTRDLCVARRIATNTPLQALVTLNDPVYVECAAALADRAIEQHPQSIDQAIGWMYQTVLGLEADADDANELRSLYNDLGAASPLADSESSDQQPHPEDASEATLDRQAMAIVASTILNLDLALTK